MKQVDELKKSMLAAGISQFDANLYLLCLSEVKNKTITFVANTLGVERRTVYSAIKRLEDLGLIKKPTQTPRQGVDIEPPNRVLQILEKKRSELVYQQYQFEESLPDLMAIYGLQDKGAAVKYFEGKKQFMLALDEMLKESKFEILYVGDYLSYVNYLTYEAEINWQKKRIIKKVNLKMLLKSEDFAGKQSLPASDERQLVERKYLASPLMGNASVFIYGGKALICLPELEKITLIEDRSFVEVIRQLYLVAWQV